MSDLVKLLRDAPLGDDTTDQLGQEEAKRTLRRAVMSIDPPACIALYGGWGSGKTTLLRRTQRLLDAAKDTTVWFDPWQYERREDVVSPLLNAILKVARDRKGDPDRMKKIKRLGLGIAKTTLSLAARVAVGVATGGILNPSVVLPAVASVKPEDFEKHFAEWQEFHDDIELAKRRFQELVEHLLADQPAGSRLIVFLDDLDRCLPDTVVQLIEAVKLLLCGGDARAVFVFALDREVVGEAIRHRYPGSLTYTGESYLEKIFDLSLETPATQVTHVGSFVKGQYTSESDLSRLDDALTTQGCKGLTLLHEILAEPVFANPRVIKRTLNRLTLLLADPERVEKVKAIQPLESKKQFLVWLAGAERFRSFRHFVRRATVADYDDLLSPTPGPVLGPIVNNPGFNAFRQLLSVDNLRALANDFRPPRGYTPQSRLPEFDDLLRSAGL